MALRPLHGATRGLIHPALHERIWSLEPLQNGTFDYGGDARIRRVLLARAKISVGARSTFEITSDDVNRLLAGRDELSLRSGALLAVSLIFFMVVGGKEHRLRVELRPPARSRIPDHPLAEHVLAYLTEQGVKLR